MENDYDEDYETSPKLLRLVEQETKEIKSHQENVETDNWGRKVRKKKSKYAPT